MSALFIGRGECRPGTVKKDAAGNVIEQTGAKWEPNAEGGCVAICDSTNRRARRRSTATTP